MVERVAMLGFEGTDAAIVQRGIDEGWMPAMAALAREGRFVRLAGQQDILGDAAAATLVCACPAEDHLLLTPSQIEPGSYRMREVDETDGRRPPFWVHLDRAGRSSTLVSIYSAPLVPGLRGTQIVGWGSNDPFTTRGGRAPRAEPADALRLLEREIGPREMRHGRQHPRTAEERRVFFAALVDGARRQLADLELMLRRTSWDFFFGSVVEAHVAGHLGLGPWSPGEPFAEDGVSEAVRAAYAAVDEGVGSLRAACPPGTAFLVVSVYGMVANNGAGEFVDPILEAGGWLTWRPSRGSRAATGSSARLRLLRAGRGVVRRVVPASLRPRLGTLVPRSRWLDEIAVGEVDWRRTRAFALPSDVSSYLRLNVVGREAEGVVRPGAEYDSLATSSWGS